MAPAVGAQAHPLAARAHDVRPFFFRPGEKVGTIWCEDWESDCHISLAGLLRDFNRGWWDMRCADVIRAAVIAAAIAVGTGVFGGRPAAADVSPLFYYTFPDSSSDVVANPAVTDRSGAGNHGNVSGTGLSGTGLSTNVPAGKTGQSLDFTQAGTHVLRTDATQLLGTPAVAQAGGFTYEVWVYPVAFPSGTSLFKLIDYAGTESLAVTSTGTIRATLNSTAGTALHSTNAITLNEWHHLIMTFDTKGNQAEPDPAPTRAGFFQVNGEVSLTVNGVASGPITHLRNGFGDSLNRTFGVGAHPTSASGERFLGLIYDPKVSLGVVPEPTSVGLLGAAALCLLARRRVPA
jgi:hypothetical protein